VGRATNVVFAWIHAAVLGAPGAAVDGTVTSNAKPEPVDRVMQPHVNAAMRAEQRMIALGREQIRPLQLLTAARASSMIASRRGSILVREGGRSWVRSFSST
jgi:hypothetical protein